MDIDYKTLVGRRIQLMFGEDRMYTDEIVIDIKNEDFRSWLVEFSMNRGYIPVISLPYWGHYVTVSFIRQFTPC